MLGKRIQRLFDPTVGGERKSALSIGALAGLLATLAAFGSGVGPAALLWGATAFAAVGIPLLYLFRGQRKSTQEARDLWGLTGVIVSGRAWPAPGGWALGAAALTFLSDEIRRRRYSNVVELGPGVSSIVLGHTNPGLEMYGLEHDGRFVEIVADRIEFHGVDGYSLIHAPLEPGAGGTPWYSREALDQLPESIDVLVVDGPPNWRAAGNRRPAWRELGDRIAPGGLVLVDDTNRRDERQMALEWLREPNVELVYDGEDFMALRVGKRASQPE